VLYFAPAPPRLRCPGLGPAIAHKCSDMRRGRKPHADPRPELERNAMANDPFVFAPPSPAP
jgi:hypothetical protein